MQKSTTDVIEPGDKSSVSGMEAAGRFSKEVLSVSLCKQTVKLLVPIQFKVAINS